MPNGKKSKRKYYTEFNLAEFIAKDKCVICGHSNALEYEGEPPDTYDPPPDFPIVSTIKEYFFVVCADCRRNIFDGLCIACTKEKEYVNQEADYVILNIVQSLSKEIIRLRSALTKAIPAAKKYYKVQESDISKKTKDIRSLIKRKKKHGEKEV